ncbi:MAG: DUF1080 domain-containing protein [Verrucomicrobiaceae bacterium]|nr:DUF1080 domain-containing protein [Verrucomicrobiaceae bacterium]
MKSSLALIAAVSLAGLLHAEEKMLFNGKDLTGWKGQDEFWSVQDGAITGHTTTEHMVTENTFLIYQGGEVADFELTLKYKIIDADGKSDKFGNSGIQYRSKIVKPEYSVVSGYQADFECGKTYSGILYEEKGRGILAKRGEKVVIHEGEKETTDKKGNAKKAPNIEVTGSVGVSDEIQAAIHPADWNEYKIVAKGGHLQHFINGRQTIDVTDETTVGAKSGLLAFQLHRGPTGMTVQFKDIKLVELK